MDSSVAFFQSDWLGIIAAMSQQRSKGGGTEQKTMCLFSRLMGFATLQGRRSLPAVGMGTTELV